MLVGCSVQLHLIRDIKYRTGKQNQDADNLSRRLHGELTNDSSLQEESLRIHEFTTHHLASVDAVKAICQYHAAVHEEAPSHCLVDLPSTQMLSCLLSHLSMVSSQS